MVGTSGPVCSLARLALVVLRGSLCLSLTVSVACSFSMRTVASNWSEEHKPVCDPDSGKPGLDALMGILGGVIGTAMLLNVEDCEEGSSGGPCGPGNAALGGLGVGLLTIGAIYGGSSLYGFSKRSTCRRAKAAHLAWRRAQSTPAEQPPTAAEGARGGAGGRCLANGTCLDGFHCIPETDRCGEGAVGTAGATCYANDTCDAGLVCDTSVWRCVDATEPVEGAR